MSWAWRKRVCPACGYLVTGGHSIFQLSVGTYIFPNITPTGGRLISEWHENHFDEFPLRPQSGPYACSVCQVAINNQERVIYGAIGTKPANPYARAERRGYNLHLVAHEPCWQQNQDDIIARKLQKLGKILEADSW